MAFISIPSTDIDADSPVTVSLMTTIKDNFDDHESRLLDVESFTSGTDATEVTGTSQAIAAGGRYIANNSTTRINFTIPATFQIGGKFEIIGKGSAGWKITCNSGQTLYRDTFSTTSDIWSDGQYSSVEVVCVTADTAFVVVDSQGTTTQGMLYGYFLGGASTVGSGSTAGTNIIDRLVFSDETCAVVTATLATARVYTSGVSSLTKGYTIGGFSTAGSRLTSIESLTFSTETRAAVSGTLNGGKAYSAGVSDVLTKGYSMGGDASTVIEDLVYSNESSSAITATLATGTESAIPFQSGTKGYHAGNRNTNNNIIQALLFSNETRSTLSATLSFSGGMGAGAFSSTKGYTMGGSDSGGFKNVLNAITFSDDTRATLSATLSSNRRGMYGVSAATKGYCAGGEDSGTTNIMEDINFSDDSSSAVSATLSANRGIGSSAQY